MPMTKWNNDAWARARGNPHRHQKLVSQLLQRLRESLGLTQAEIGSQIGVSGDTIQRWERSNGTFPNQLRWRRIRDLWQLKRILAIPEYWLDREEDIDFRQ